MTLKVFWPGRYQVGHVRDLLGYLISKIPGGTVDRVAHDTVQYIFSVYTHAGNYSNVLFSEIERYGEDWTKFTVTPWVIRENCRGEWCRYRTFDRWRNRKALLKHPEVYMQIDIELIRPEVDAEELGEEIKYVEREMDEG